jgi:hypothetical protein
MIKDTAGILAGVQSPMPQPHRREVYGKKKKKEERRNTRRIREKQRPSFPWKIADWHRTSNPFTDRN